jgi:hypothetical protein
VGAREELERLARAAVAWAAYEERVRAEGRQGHVVSVSAGLSLRSDVMEACRRYFAASAPGGDASRRSRDDGGAAEVVGVVLCLGVLVVLAGVASLMVTGWCAPAAPCGSHLGERAFAGTPRDYCSEHPNEAPACVAGEPELRASAKELGASNWCRQAPGLPRGVLLCQLVNVELAKPGAL